tara:strand:- start:111 stop:758 length:648 start_codon:yes stop_codon:yes gene_type:complete
MSWENILKLKKYNIQQVKDVFLNRETISYGFKGDPPTLIEHHLFDYIYFNKPLSTKVRMECKRFAAKAEDMDASTFLNNLSIAGGKIITNDKGLPFSLDEVSINNIRVLRKNTPLQSMEVAMHIRLYGSDILYIELKMYDGLYSFEGIKYKGYRATGGIAPSSLESNIPFITKVLDKYNPSVTIFEHGELNSSWGKRSTNIEEVIEEIEYIGDRL